MKKILAFVLTGLALLLLGCASQSNAPGGQQANATVSTQGGGELKAAIGDTVAVDYVGSFDDGKVFDTSSKSEAEKAGLPLRDSYAPLEFRIGAHQVIKGFENAVVGMKAGDEKTVRLPPSEAYGEKRSDLIVEVPRGNFNGTVSEGKMVQAANGMAGTIVKVTDANVTIDFNSQMAGKTLNFKIILRKITPAR